MNAEQSLSRILESLYGKTGTSEEWPELLGDVVSYTGGEVGKLIVGELHADRPWMLAMSNRSSDNLSAFMKRYGFRQDRDASPSGPDARPARMPVAAAADRSGAVAGRRGRVRSRRSGHRP
jgi:hypothetical protein